MKAELRSRKKLLSAAVAAIVFLFVQEAVSQAEEITAIRKELQSEVQAGRYEQAVKVSERLIAKLEATYPEPNEQHVAAYTDHGVIQKGLGQHGQSVTSLKKALDLTTNVPKVTSESRIEIMRLLATAYERSGDGRSARETYMNAVEFADAKGLGNSKAAFYIVLGAANELARDSKYGQAHEYYLRALRLSYEHFEIDSKERHELTVYYTCLFEPRRRDSKLQNEYSNLAKELSEREKTNENVVPGKALRLGRPVYPVALRRANVTGSVTVFVSISAEGNVTEATAVCGERRLSKLAEDAAMKSKFEPTFKNGKPIATRGQLTFNFALEQR